MFYASSRPCASPRPTPRASPTSWRSPSERYSGPGDQGWVTLKPVSSSSLRLGLGILFILAGALYVATMVLATLNALGLLRGLHIERRGWTLLYYSNYYFLVLGGLVYLGLTWIKSRVFILQTVIDFAIGLVIYNALYYLSAHLLIRGWVNPWASVIPGLVLIAYGVSLRRNRGLWTPRGL